MCISTWVCRLRLFQVGTAGGLTFDVNQSRTTSLLAYRIETSRTRGRKLRLRVGIGAQLTNRPLCDGLFLPGNPGGRALIFSAIGDLALQAGGDKFKYDLSAAIQASPLMFLGGGENQPMASQDGVGPVHGEDLIAAVRIHFQGWSRARTHLSRHLHARAFIRSGEIRLGLRLRATEEKSGGDDEEDLCCVGKMSVMNSQSAPWTPEQRGPESRYLQSGAHSEKNTASLVP